MISAFLCLALLGQEKVATLPSHKTGLPQTVPLKYYTTAVYAFGRESEDEEGPESPNDQWWDAKLDGSTIGAPKSPGKVELRRAARAAWGMMWWGQELKQFDWIGHADDLINLTLAAPRRGSYHAAKCWIDPLRWENYGTPAGDAEMARWYLRWLAEWPEAPQKQAMLQRVRLLLDQLGEAEPTLDWEVYKFLVEVSTNKLLGSEDSGKAGAILARIQMPAPPVPYQVSKVDESPLVLMRSGAASHEKTLFEEGVALLKSGLMRLHEGTLVTNGIVVPRPVRLGGMAPIDGSGRFVIPGDYTFERYEGQLLANFAEVTKEFGGYYIDPSGWAVGIDGCRATPRGPVSTIATNPFPYNGEHTVDIVEPGKERRKVEVLVLPSIARVEVIEGKLVAIPGAMRLSGKPTLTGRFKMQGKKWSHVAKVGLRGFEAPWPKGVRTGSFLFNGKINGTAVSFGPVKLHRG